MKKYLFIALFPLILASCGGTPAPVDSTSGNSSNPGTFSVEFYNDKDYKDFLWSTVANKGDNVIYNGEMPTKEGTAEYSYTFVRFDKSTLNVQENIKTYAIYRIDYTCTDGLVFTLNSDESSFSVSGYTGTSAKVIVPEMYRVNNESKLMPVTGIAKQAFFNKNITDISLPSSIKTIGESAFHTCKKLTKIVVPNEVKSIGINAFAYCSSMVSISIPASVEAFNLAYSLIGCTSLTTITIDPLSPLDYKVNNDGVVFNKAQTKLVYFPASKNVSSYIVPSSVLSIGISAFDSTQLKTLTISEGCTTIESAAFDESKIETLKLPASLTTISGSVADRSFSLETITVASASQNFVVIDGMLMRIEENATKTLIMYPNANTLEDLVIPSSVAAIGPKALNSALNLKTIFVPDTVKKIDGNAFRDRGLIYLGWNESSTTNSTNFDSFRTSVVHSSTNDMYLYSLEEPSVKPSAAGYRYWHYVGDVKTLWPGQDY